MATPASQKLYRFGGFEVDLNAGEVRKHGIRIRVQDQPLLLLSALLECPGALVTREELQSRLWADHTFVDFENGLNTAAARLRQVLGDSARTPRFIESVPRRGYRFIAAVETVPINGQRVEQASALPDQPYRDNQRGRRRSLLLIAGFALIAAAIVWRPDFRDHSSDVTSFKFSLMPPDGTTFVAHNPIVLSPDGRLMAFPATDASGDTELWIRPVDELLARRMEGTKGASFPFWSPDGRSIAFFANGKLSRVEIAGGPPKILCDAADGRGGSWSREGVIVFAPALRSPLMQAPPAGGEPKPLTALDRARREVSHRWPSFLPDGRHFLYLVRTENPQDSGVYMGSIAGDQSLPLIRTLSNAVYAKDKSGNGYVLFARGTTLIGWPFDARRLRMNGIEFPITEIRQASFREPMLADFSASESGVIAYHPERGADRLTWFDRSGVRLGTLGESVVHLDVSLSPNDESVAFSRQEPNTGRYDIWRVNCASGAATRLTYGPKDQFAPVWSPDSSHISYSSMYLVTKTPGTSGEIYEIPAAGGPYKLLLKSDNLKVPWSTNGRFLLYHEIQSGKKFDTWSLPTQGGKPIALLQSQFNQLFAVFSPDGKWLAYTSDESGKREVYVTPFAPGATSTTRWLVSKGGGSQPQWPRDGSQLYYLAPDKRIMTVPVRTTGDRFQCDAPRALFQSDIIDDFRARFAVTSDGQRFLIPSAAGQAGSSFTTVIVNWTPGNRD